MTRSNNPDKTKGMAGILIVADHLLSEKTINKKVLYFTANKGGGFLGGIKSLDSLEKKVDQIVYST
ncbi:MAG: hypothetical protein Q8M56_19540, partial [Desulfobacterales bacterium]|nr:hypothetical protein [Desulfobacterales bacterium]